MPLRLQRNRHSPRSLLVAIRYLALTGLLSACITDSFRSPPITTANSGGAQNLNECSLIGRLACSTMAIVTFEGSDSQQATCTASREGGMLIESCGTAVGRTAIIA